MPATKSQKYLLLSLLLAITPFLAHAQTKDKLPVGSGAANPVETQPRGMNILSQTEYDAITYNGYTIKQINATNGTFENLWGAFSKKEESVTGFVYNYSVNYVLLNTETNTSKYVSLLEINNSSWPVKIKGKTVKVGDTFESLKQKFGQNLKIFYNPKSNSDEYTIGFNTNTNDWDGIGIDFDLATNRVKQIAYFVMP